MIFCGILAAYIDTATASRITALKSDLRNLELAQGDFKRDSGRYSEMPPGSFQTSTGVVGPVVTLTPNGWTVSVTHQQVPVTCTIFVGNTPIAPAVEEPTSACTRSSFDAKDYLFGFAVIVVGGVLAALARVLERQIPSDDAA